MVEGSVGPRSERPFNEERQFGEAKLPVFNWSERMQQRAKPVAGLQEIFRRREEQQDGRVISDLKTPAHNVMPISERP
jgi:hypothetical protein